MPELPEVETTRRGIEPLLAGKVARNMLLRCTKLRRPIPRSLANVIQNQRLQAVGRRAKYLLFDFDRGQLLVHLGMSGSLRVLNQAKPAHKHDHWDINFDDNKTLRFTDPRRFGLTLWRDQNDDQGSLLDHLGVEPLTAGFNGQYLLQRARCRRVNVKSFIMDQRIVVGVGNIYASEALWLAGINPKRSAGRIALARYEKLTKAIKKVLNNAIEAGGTSLRDFSGVDGKPGYFQLRLRVYDREGKACRRCAGTIRRIVTTGRSTYYCPQCQH
ncbi:MAG: bifunctional DNA-formamidopyrimidine glycosylase/DNA-(apurinic or apyrimidinic site) lyase [Gammaproteobacteria bacterium]|nr:bifunctional DNA-formamidopyrimidine glycosylase/DNA-(apurinic or apyrimidinic site) lyase [Gammaproteobacteria bacterium]